MAKHSSTPRGLRDEANVGPDPRQARHLVPLKELGKFTVAADDPDIRGWSAFTSTGREIGRVDELLVDTATNEVVMLDIDLRRDDRHTLAPLRAAWIDHAARRVVIDARELGDADMPSLSRRAALTDDEVRRFDEGYGRAYAAYPEDRELRVRHADDELRFGRRGDDVDRDVVRNADRDRDRDGVDDRVERAASRADVEADRAARAERAEEVRRQERRVERHRPDPDGYRVADVGERNIRVPRRTDEMVVERRPFVEEVVVRRRAAGDSGAELGADDAGRDRLDDRLDDRPGDRRI
jgi:hypothetical protein